MSASLFFFIPFKMDEKCDWQNDFNKKLFEGVVVNKFIDSSQHSTPLIEIRNLKDNSIDSIDLFGDKSAVFDLINKYDTLYKPSKNNSVFVEDKNKLKLIGQVNFGCKD
jgi:hypothetical protein